MHWRLLSSWFRSIDGLDEDKSCRFRSPNSVGEEDALLSQSKCKSTQYGDKLAFKVFQKLVSNARANLPSFSSNCGHVTEKHVPIGCKHDMFGNQPFEV